jgi:ribosomal protein L7Ae-like RNA K-turn-binding protein
LTKIGGLISIARKAGYVILGQDNLKNYDKKLYALLLDKTAGNSLSREMNFLANKKNIPLIVVENLAEMVSIENCKVIGIKNKPMTDKILECLEIKGE